MRRSNLFIRKNQEFFFFFSNLKKQSQICFKMYFENCAQWQSTVRPNQYIRVARSFQKAKWQPWSTSKVPYLTLLTSCGKIQIIIRSDHHFWDTLILPFDVTLLLVILNYSSLNYSITQIRFLKKIVCVKTANLKKE